MTRLLVLSMPAWLLVAQETHSCPSSTLVFIARIRKFMIFESLLLLSDLLVSICRRLTKFEIAPWIQTKEQGRVNLHHRLLALQLQNLSSYEPTLLGLIESIKLNQIHEPRILQFNLLIRLVQFTLHFLRVINQLVLNKP